jgi:hypothetical protein
MKIIGLARPGDPVELLSGTVAEVLADIAGANVHPDLELLPADRAADALELLGGGREPDQRVRQRQSSAKSPQFTRWPLRLPPRHALR